MFSVCSWKHVNAKHIAIFFPFYFLLNFKHIETAALTFHLNDHIYIVCMFQKFTLL